MAEKRPVALSIAGSDPSGGAGIQADLKTFHQHGVYGGAVVSLLTVQNTQRLARVEVVSADLVAAQLNAVIADLHVAAIKTGALGSAEVVDAVADSLAGRAIPLVIDPVRIASHGAALLEDGARAALIERLMPLAHLITPNAAEAEWLTGRAVRSVADAERAAGELLAAGARAVLLKGGHLDAQDAVDVYAVGAERLLLRAPRAPDVARHGLGCSLSAAITARLARGEQLLDACRAAKAWLRAAMQSAPAIGAGRRPVDHFASLPSALEEEDRAR